MRNLILTLLFLAGCATPNSRIDSLEKEVANLKSSDTYHSYVTMHNECFIFYGICLAEKKKVQKECWAHHETCVINTHRQWKDLLNAKPK